MLRRRCGVKAYCRLQRTWLAYNSITTVVVLYFIAEVLLEKTLAKHLRSSVKLQKRNELSCCCFMSQQQPDVKHNIDAPCF